MNPPNLNPYHLSGLHQNLSTVGAASASHQTRDYWDYPSSCSSVGWKQPSPSNAPVHRLDSHPDGEHLGQDLELVGKKNMLREVEESFGHKKAFVAQKSTGFNTLSQGSDAASASCETLRDRVMGILQQKHSPSFFTKTQSPKEEPDSSSLTQDLHPLQHRVKVLMKQRSGGSGVLPSRGQEVSVVSQQHPASPAKQEKSVGKGFERFLNLLNKGVDINLLSRIVNDDTDAPLAGGQLPNVPSRAVAIKPSPPVRGQTRRLNSDAPSTVKSRSRPSPKEVKSDRGGRRPLSSSSGSKSPAPQKKKHKKEDPEKPQVVDEKSKQLQDIVKSLGLDLKVEELSRLSDRTQERLYGMKSEVQHCTESQKKSFHREYSRSSSSSSSSSSSYSSSSSSSSWSSSSRSSSSRSPSPPRRRRPRSPNEGYRRRAEHRGGGQRDRAMRDRAMRDRAMRDRAMRDRAMRDRAMSRDRTMSRDSSQEFKDASNYRHMEATQTNSYHSAAAAAYPHYSESQYYQYVNSTSGQNSYPSWPEDSGSSSLFLGYPDPVGAPELPDTRYEHMKDLVLLANPDLAESEGQCGNLSDNRCLRFINTEQCTDRHDLSFIDTVQPSDHHCKKVKTKQSTGKRCLTLIETKQPVINRHILNLATIEPGSADYEKKKKILKARYKRKQKMKTRKLQEFLVQTSAAHASAQSQAATQKVEESCQREDDGSSASNDETLRPTEEEVKANLRKKLEAFNQKAKHNNNNQLAFRSSVQPNSSLETPN